MEFTLLDYLSSQTKNAYFYPSNFFPHIQIDRTKYREQEEEHEKNGSSSSKAFKELKKRVGKDYYEKVYRSQTSALNFSERAFPNYKFILPEVIADDWLSIVGWHKEHSRDHALHQPLTAYIVNMLLGGGNSSLAFKIDDSNLLDLSVDKILEWRKTKYIKDYLINIGVKQEHPYFEDNQISRVVWKSMFYETCLVAAIFHDMGYPWEYINGLNCKLSATNFSMDNAISDAEHVYNNFQNRLVLLPFNGYKSLNNDVPCNWKKNLIDLISFSLTKTHAFPGALGFISLNDITREYPTKKDLPFHQFCRDWAAMGIMMHDMKKIYQGNKKNTAPDNKQFRVEFDRDPLSAIIALADVLEEFERPNVEFKAGKNTNKNNTDENTTSKDGIEFCYDSACVGSEMIFNINNKELTITYLYKSAQGVAAKLPWIGKEEKEIFDPYNGYLDFSSIGINKVNLKV